MSTDARFPHVPTIVHALVEAVAQEPDLPALICRDQQVTYAQLGRAVAGFAHRLESLPAGRPERVLIMMPNGIETAVAILAAMAAGAQAAPVNPFFTEHELEPMVRTTEASVVVCDASTEAKARALAQQVGIADVLVMGTGADRLESWIDDPGLRLAIGPTLGPDRLALLLFTGGTTGVPKGVDHTHRAITWSFCLHCRVWPVDYGAERFLTVTPMFHIWGLGYALLVPIYARSTLVIVPRYEPDTVVNELARHRVTIFGGGPAPIYMGLLGSPAMASADFSALKYCLSGGAPCPEELHRRWLEVTGCALFEGWGMTEGAPFCLNPAHGVRKLLSVGLPVPETVVQAVDLETGTRVLPVGEAGELRVRGAQITHGYRNNPEETAIALRDGWMYTGDIGYLDDDGYVFIVDRKKEMVIVGGYNVYPRQVEEALFQYGPIQEAAVVGRPDDRLGETLVAFVVLRPGASLDRDDFFAFCKQELVKYKRPVDVKVIDALPRTGPGKINKRALRQQLADA